MGINSKSMVYILSTEELKEKFGDIHLQIISSRGNNRTSCIRRDSDNAVLAYNTVMFHNEGIMALGTEFHQQILSGKAIGQTIKNSDVPHGRIVSEAFLTEIYFGLNFLFYTKQTACLARKVEYKIKNLLYVSVVEFYNPEYMSVAEDFVQTNEELFISEEGWFVVDNLKSGFEDQYLRLTHGFLKNPIHVSIENQDTFVAETQQTLGLLMKDINTKLFVAASNKEFIGYVAINIHPALHVNGLECVVRELYVKEKYQGNGIGGALMEYVECYAKEQNCKRISLATKWDDENKENFMRV